MDYQTLKAELRKRCLDLGMIQRPEVRYGEILNHCIKQYPLALWPLDDNSGSLATVAGQREYDLSVDPLVLDEAKQVRRVWIDDGDGVAHRTGRYEAKDMGGKPYLVLDVAPTTSGYAITVEHRDAPGALSSPTSMTKVDDMWLLARAMLTCLAEADPAVIPRQEAYGQIELYSNLLGNRERQLLSQGRRARKTRTIAWREYVK